MTKALPLLLLALLLPALSRGTTTYDPGGLPLSVTDPLGRTTLNQYDALGRLVQTTAPTGAVTKFTYDAAGNRTSVEDGKGNTTTFTYDLQNRVLTETFANGNTVVHAYDELRETSRTSGGLSVAYTYDALDRLKTVNPPGAAMGSQLPLLKPDSQPL